ncbi:MAG: VOC family protein [Novosphingobium sp.]|nr:VOC family protein [Novosphingobium sp.]
MRLSGHYQNGYVTHDLDRGLEIFDERFGVDSFGSYDADVQVTTPSGVRRLAMRIAAGWVGGLNIELMQPVSGHVDPLLAMLPDDTGDPVPRFHHFALRRDNLGQMREEIAGCGLPLAFAGEPAGMAFAYLDARASLGHYIELVWKEPGGWAKIGWPEGKPAL